jgi:hypothetical protein
MDFSAYVQGCVYGGDAYESVVLLQRYMIFMLDYKAGPGNFSPGGGVI